MGRTILTFIFMLTLGLALTSFALAEIEIQQPSGLYSFGDSFSVQTTIKASEVINGFFNMRLMCGDQEQEFYKEYIILEAGQEKTVNPSIILIKDLVGELKGDCRIKATLGDETASTEEFSLSNLIDINIDSANSEFSPGEEVTIQGTATKANNQAVSGTVELEIESQSVSLQSSTTNGNFALTFTIDETADSGPHLMKIKVYERGPLGEITNEGFIDSNLVVRQVATSLELVIEDSEIIPGETLRIKSVLRDQTGEKMPGGSKITIKNSVGAIILESEASNDEFIDYFVPRNEPPQDWTFNAESNGLQTEIVSTVATKKEVSLDLQNETLVVTNTGNVIYDDIISVKIGEETMNVPVTLEVDAVKVYSLKAPTGRYPVEVSDTQSTIAEDLTLTGKSIEVREVQKGISGITRSPLAWIFIIAVLGFMLFIVMKKNIVTKVRGKINAHRSSRNSQGQHQEQGLKIAPPSPSAGSHDLRNLNELPESTAEISLSLQGEKQNSSIVCLKIKNLGSIDMKKPNSSAKEIIGKIAQDADDKKAALYKDEDNLFFLFLPTLTKTFKNEKSALAFAKSIEASLKEHNKTKEQKINFGLSLNIGAMIAQKEQGQDKNKDSNLKLKFMSLGSLIPALKKMAGISSQELLLGEAVNKSLGSQIKSEKNSKDKFNYYKLNEVRDRGTEEHTKFINNFMRSIEADKKSRADSKKQ